VQKHVPEFQGPHFGAKLADANPRNFDQSKLKTSAAVSKLNMGSALTMERRGFDISASVTFGNQYVGASKCDAPTFLTTGDATVTSPLGIDAAKVMGTAPAGSSTSNAATSPTNAPPSS
jgi:hypothetical protein